MEFFIDIKSFRSHYGPVVDTASNRNEYREYFLGCKGGRCVRLTNLPSSCAVVTKSGNLNFLEPSGPLQACNGTALPLSLLFYKELIGTNWQQLRNKAKLRSLYNVKRAMARRQSRAIRRTVLRQMAVNVSENCSTSIFLHICENNDATSFETSVTTRRYTTDEQNLQ